MIARLRAWLRWKFKIGWTYTGSTIARSPDIVGGDQYIEKNWINVHTQERRSSFGGWYDDGTYCP